MRSPWIRAVEGRGGPAGGGGEPERTNTHTKSTTEGACEIWAARAFRRSCGRRCRSARGPCREVWLGNRSERTCQPKRLAAEGEEEEEEKVVGWWWWWRRCPPRWGPRVALAHPPRRRPCRIYRTSAISPRRRGRSSWQWWLGKRRKRIKNKPCWSKDNVFFFFSVEVRSRKASERRLGRPL